MMMLANIAFDGVLTIAVVADLAQVMVFIHDLDGVICFCTMRMGKRRHMRAAEQHRKC